MFKYKIHYKNLLIEIENLSKVMFTSVSHLTESFTLCTLCQELTVTQDYLFFNVFYLFNFTFEPMEFFIINGSYIRQKCLM